MIVRVLALSIVCAATAAAQAQQADFRWEKALAAGSTVALHNINGDVTVTPSTSGKVEIVGVKRGNRTYFEDITLEVVESSRGITVCSMRRDMDMECDEDGLRTHDSWGRRGRRGRDWDDVQINIEVKLPANLQLSAHSVSGNVSAVGAQGDVRAASVSGDVRLERLRARNIKATSVSGDVVVAVDTLTGDGRFTSVSGNVMVELPKGIDADVTMGSVSGSLDSEFPLLLNGRLNRHSLEARIGRGGRQLEVRTVSGDVRLRQSKP